MFKRTLITHSIAFASLLSFGYAFTDETTQEISLTQHISNKYLISTFGIEKPTPAPTDNVSGNFIEKFKQQIDAKKQSLTPREIQEVAFNLVASTQTFETTIIDSSCIDKLEIVGGGENCQQHLFGNIFNQITTTIGKAYAALTFCHPTSDIATLHKRQQVIGRLSEHTNYTKQLDSILHNIKTTEAKSLMFWHSKAPVNPELIKFSYFGQQLDFFNILKKIEH